MITEQELFELNFNLWIKDPRKHDFNWIEMFKYSVFDLCNSAYLSSDASGDAERKFKYVALAVQENFNWLLSIPITFDGDVEDDFPKIF